MSTRDEAQAHKELRSRIDVLESQVSMLPTKEDIEEIMFTVVKRALKSSYGGLLVIAAIIGALAIIGGGAKALLGFIGIGIIKQ